MRSAIVINPTEQFPNNGGAKDDTTMGINACILDWFDALAQTGAFEGQTSVLELGPQDYFFSSSKLSDIAVRRLGAREGMSATDRILDANTAFEERKALFYSIFGLEKYSSVDTYDERATLRQDLNIAEAFPHKFDVLVDCGTSEHVFNVANVFKYTHNSLNVGGISLKVLPTFGDNAHGFYNIHPTVYFDVARENDYEIVDFRYVDNMTGRSEDLGASSLMSPSQMVDNLRSFSGCATLQETISRNFLSILEKAAEDGRLSEAHNSVDYCFVAMRKTRDLEFRFPGQGVYLTEFPPSAHAVPQPASSPEIVHVMDDKTVEILFGSEFLELWRQIQPYTMVSEERAFATYKACRHVAVHNIPGDFVECGVYRGGMALLACEVFKRYSKTDRHIWLFDTFGGMTKPESVDADRSGLSAAEALEADPQMCLATLEEVQNNLSVSAYPEEKLHFVRGDVLETLSDNANLPRRIAVLRLDTDWHASTKKELDVLYPILSTGGVCLVDDYGHWLGARLAVDEFISEATPAVYVSRTDTTGVEFVKPAPRGLGSIVKAFFKIR